MSAPSGIKVPPSLTSAFSTAQGNSQNVRALVFVIEGEAFSHLTTVEPKSTFKDDIALLPATLPNQKTPASFAYRLDTKEGGRHEWMMITFVPDDAGVRAKMLQASSRAGLMKALGANNFKHDWFATNINDLSPSALSSHMRHLDSPAPLSASEKALAEVREAEAAEAKRAALDPETEARRKRAVVGLGGKMAWGDGVADAMAKVAQRSDDGHIVILEIPANNSAAISLHTSSACTPSQLASKLPGKSPCFVFYSFPTPPPPAPAPAPTKKWESKSQSTPGNTFHATEGGRRFVATTWQSNQDAEPSKADASSADEKTADAKEDNGEKAEGAEKEEVKEDEGEKKEGVDEIKDLSIDEDKEKKEEATEKSPESPEEEVAAPLPVKEVKGRVIFVYSCPSGSPVKYRMVYSTNVRGIQQDAVDKAGVEIHAKLETSDPADLTESHLRTSIPTAKPKQSSLPNPASPSSNSQSSFGAPKPAFGAPAPAFGGAFGRPRPVVKKDSAMSTSSISSNTSASQIPLPASEGPSSPISMNPGEEDSKDSIRKAFDAFGPRVGGGGAGGFARPRPAGKR